MNERKKKREEELGGGGRGQGVVVCIDERWDNATRQQWAPRGGATTDCSADDNGSNDRAVAVGGTLAGPPAADAAAAWTISRPLILSLAGALLLLRED